MTTATTIVDDLARAIGALASPDLAGDDATRIDLISQLESLKAAAAAAQARLTVDFDASQRREQAARGVPARRQGLGVAHQVALARRDSPRRGARHLGLAKALVREMPHTLRALADGRISEWRATILVRETAVLSAQHRGMVDTALADKLGELGDRALEREAKKLAYRLDPASVVRRHRRAVGERHVSIRPAPDTMSYVTGLLPVAQGVAVHAALTKHAESLRAAGDPRSRGQIMADTFVERLTGQNKATGVPVEVQLVMTDRTLLGGDDSPARLVGHGPVPAFLARALLTGNDEARAWIRRLYRHPTTGELVAMESRRRDFPAGLRRFLVVRDEVCRTPWCDAPIRHADHVRRAADGGPTSAANGQGLCESCNQAKEAGGWQHTAPASRAGPITVRTPTGHHYTSRPPDLPGDPPPATRTGAEPTGQMATGMAAPSALEEQLSRLVLAA